MHRLRIDPRSAPLRTLADEHFQVLIIGGGINGAGIARDLAMRGIKVALVEKEDIASGTSSASTKLIHGGLRYLENLHIGLVRESCRERGLLLKLAPHLVRPLPFLIPVYREDPRPLMVIRAGLSLYDLLSGSDHLPRHQVFNKKEAVERCPSLREKGLTGAAHYWDCRMDDARLCLEVALSAREYGATVVTGVEVTGFERQSGRLAAAKVRDVESGSIFEVRADLIINAAGPWLDGVRAMATPAKPLLRPTRGTHILVPRIGRHKEALYLTAGSDKRLFFAIPQGEFSLIGTTDVDFSDDPDRVAPVDEDVDYLIAEACRHLEGVNINRDDVVAAFAGLRPLIAADGAFASAVSREHRIVEDDDGLITIGGGKYTTFRAIAAEVVEYALDRLGLEGYPCITGREELPGAMPVLDEVLMRAESAGLAAAYGVPQSVADGLLQQYGRLAGRVLACTDDSSERLPLVEGSSLLGCQVRYAVKEELARTPADLLRRRTPLALGDGRGLKELPAVVAMMGELLGISVEGRNHWIADYTTKYGTLFGTTPNQGV